MTLTVEQAASIQPAHIEDGLLSVVVFGPGTGEAILVRFPNGNVGVIDGCRRSGEAFDPVAEVLRALKVTRLYFACLTHPHEDHFGGLVDVVREFDPEHLLWAGTEHERLLEKFAKEFQNYQTKKDAIASGVSPKELTSLIREFVRRSQRRRGTVPRARAQALSDHKKLLTLPSKYGAVEVWSVMPTTTALHRALGKNPATDPTPSEDDEPRMGVGAVDPNHVSGALLLRWGHAAALLGGDVLTGRSDHHEGWDVADWVEGPVQVVKVAHHGSRGAHCKELWDRLKPSLALVTPFRDAAGPQPPQEDMLSLLASNVETLALTSRPAWWPGKGTVVARPAWPDPGAVHGTALAGVLAPSRSYGAIAASLDSNGTIRRVVLAGSAAVIAPA